MSGVCRADWCTCPYRHRPGRPRSPGTTTRWDTGWVTTPLERRDVVVLGSTGSIGTQAIDIVRRAPDRFRVVGLAAGGGNVELLARQALELGVEVVAVARASAAQDLQLAFYAAAKAGGYAAGEFPVPKILAGPDAATELAGWPCDVVLNGMTGSIGLGADAGRAGGRPHARAGQQGVADRRRPAGQGGAAAARPDRAGRLRALRAGPVPARRQPERGAPAGAHRQRRPVPRPDPRRARRRHASSRRWRTRPGTWARSSRSTRRPWSTRGSRCIEAHLLFDIPFDRIDVVVHPQSVVHSMVEFVDGSTLAQASPPDMRLPIALGLGWPDRVPGRGPRLRLDHGAHLGVPARSTTTAFPAVRLARARRARPAAPRRRSTTPPTRSAWRRSSAGRLPFSASSTPSRRCSTSTRSGTSATVADVLEAEAWARERAQAAV